MWNYAGIVRTTKRLERAKSDLEYLLHRIEKFYREAAMDAKIVGLKQGIRVALMITHAPWPKSTCASAPGSTSIRTKGTGWVWRNCRTNRLTAW